MRISYFSIQGKREYQEDNLFVSEEKNIFAVVDGMGGHPNGDLAAASVVNCLKDATNLEEIKQAFIDADHECFQASDGRAAVATAMLYEDETANICHAGDSRAYIINSGEIYQITMDQVNPYGGITNYVGGGFLRQGISPTIYQTRAERGDIILICSDGVSCDFSKDTIKNSINMSLSDENPAKSICEWSIENGSTDNCTAIIIEILKD